MNTRFVSIAAGLLVSSALAAQEPLVREGVTVQLGAHTYAIPDGGVGLVPNVGIIVGERATLVIDPGLGRRNGEAVLREVAQVSDNEQLYVASTHFHPEHTTGYVAFPESARYVNSTIQEEEFEADGERFIALFSNISPVIADLLSDAERRVADITFEREYTLDLGGVTVRMFAVGPTHTRGDIGFFVVEDGVLFSGDVVMNQSFLAANQGSSISAWLAAFDTFEALEPTTIVPAHGEIGDGSLIGLQREQVQRIQARALALGAEGLPADEIASAVQGEMQAQYPGFPRVNGVAALARSALNEVQ